MRILLVEDHIELSRWLAKALRDAHLTVECAHNGADADSLLLTQDYALVILDLTLPRMDGLEVLKRMRARGSRTPVLILTARGGLADRVRASTWAPTTTWPNPSNWKNWKRASKPCCAARRARKRSPWPAAR
jgi:DNA-binding response OmpR family regulator